MHQDQDPSLTVNWQEGKLLWHCKTGCSQDAVLEELKQRGLLHELRDADGRLIGRHERKGRWFKPDGAAGLNGAKPADLLYGLEDLAKHSTTWPVVLVEGEKAADALRKVGILTVATVCGAGVTPTIDALEPLRNRRVVLWPDADEPGHEHMEHIAAILVRLGATVFIVEWQEAPDKGDAADYLTEHDQGALLTFLKTAQPWVSKIVPIGLSAAELVDLEIEPLQWSVVDRLPEGLALLIAKPKAGKSFLALQMAIAVASGRSFLDPGIMTVAGDVLYLGLEDGRRRMKDRLQDILGPTAPPQRLQLVTIEDKWGRTDQGGIERIREWIAEHPQARLIVLDTLGRFRSLNTGRGNAYMADLAALEPLQAIAINHHLTLLVLHHDNKSVAGEDWVYSISGTQAIAGTADTLVGLARRAGSKCALLKAHGRDIDEWTLALRLGGKPAMGHRIRPSTSGWTALGTWSSRAELTAEREEVLEVLADAGEPLTASEVGRRLANDDRDAESGRKTVQRMLAMGLLARTTEGVSLVPVVPPVPPSGGVSGGLTVPVVPPVPPVDPVTTVPTVPPVPPVPPSYPTPGTPGTPGTTNTTGTTGTGGREGRKDSGCHSNGQQPPACAKHLRVLDAQGRCPASGEVAS